MSKSDTAPLKRAKVLFQLSGSIACFKACALLSALVKAGFDIEVVATPSALKFVGEATLEGLTGRRVHTDTFERGRYMSHIHLVRWADVIILCPATANTLNKFASGVGDDLISTLFLAHDFKKPYLVAPAMNQTMYNHPALQKSLSTLSGWGVSVLGTGNGALACGENGEGRMLEPPEIQAAIISALATNDRAKSATHSEKQSLLITSGGTEEPIDGVRSLTNTSTGRTGAELASWFAEHGANVTLLHSEKALRPQSTKNLSLKAFSTFQSLDELLKATLAVTKFDAVIHLAAIADYSLDEVETNGATLKAPINGKINSGESLILRLKKNPKIVDSIRDYARNPDMKLVAFKLTRTLKQAERTEAIEKLAQHARPDFIVHNDLDEMTNGTHPFAIYEPVIAQPIARPIALANGTPNLAAALALLLEGARA